MLGKKIAIGSVLLYAVVMGCVMSSSGPPATTASGAGGAESSVSGDNPTPSLVHVANQQPFCGVAMQLQRVDWVEQYKKTIDDIAADGADTVSLVVDSRQEDAESTIMYVDMRKTMTVPQLTDIIDHAKSKGLRVILMPIVLLDEPQDETEWRGTLKPRDWHEWFENYREMIEHYARIAQSTHVDVLVVGSELVSSEAEEHLDEWVQTIKEVRSMYSGQLTYSSNWDRYWKVPFWKYLDFVGMNSYWTLGQNHDVSVDQIKAEWTRIQDKMFPFLERVHKPVILLEAGWCSLSNAAKDSWDYTQEQLPADNDLQKKLYEAFFESWWDKPDLAGMIVWEMHPGGDSTGKGYTPQGKPAEDVMRQWFAKPRWEIMGGQ
jgi:glycosyl hydrolase family 113